MSINIDVLHKTWWQNKQFSKLCLCLNQQNYTSDFEILLEDGNKKTTQQKPIEPLVTEVYKYLNGLSPDIINTIFKLRQSTHNLRISTYLNAKFPKQKIGLDNISWPSQPWKNDPEELRNSISLSVFRESLKKVPSISCSCNCFKKYTHHLGYI